MSPETSKMDIFARAKAHFQHRVGEWFMGGISASLGVYLLLNPSAYAVNPSFTEFRNHITQPVLGWACLLVGVLRLSVLLINGLWRPSPHLRAVCAWAGVFFWLYMCFGITYSPDPAVSLVVWPWLIILELTSTFNAMTDARISDLKARQVKRMVEGLEHGAVRSR